jgi:hypothetical protein
MDYELKFIQDDRYKIIDAFDSETKFTGTIVECNAWLQLNKNGYID